jgi:hypothetical protein
MEIRNVVARMKITVLVHAYIVLPRRYDRADIHHHVEIDSKKNRTITIAVLEWTTEYNPTTTAVAAAAPVIERWYLCKMNA